MTNGNACFAYFNKSWGIPDKRTRSSHSELFAFWPTGEVVKHARQVGSPKNSGLDMLNTSLIAFDPTETFDGPLLDQFVGGAAIPWPMRRQHGAQRLSSPIAIVLCVPHPRYYSKGKQSLARELPIKPGRTEVSAPFALAALLPSAGTKTLQRHFKLKLRSARVPSASRSARVPPY
jgi:hypothetical protein